MKTPTPWFNTTSKKLLFVLMAASAGMQAQAVKPIDPFVLKLQVSRNGTMLGVNNVELKQSKPGVWDFSGAIIGTDGLAMLAGATVKERSLLTAPKGGLELYSSFLETKVAWRRDVKTITLENDRTSYLYKDHKKSVAVPYQPGLLDQHSLTLALISDLQAGKGPTFRYQTIVKGKIEPYTFRIVENQSIETALGRLDTVKVERVRQTANGKSTLIWFAKTKNFLPVKFQELNAEGDSIDMKIIAINP
jgi:hypothetical protein